MLKKTTTVLLATLWAFTTLSPAVADEHENEGVATIVKITPKDGHDDELIEGITAYHKHVADKEGAMRYHWYEVLTGPDTGKYFARSGDHNWADFDGEYDWEEEAGKVFQEKVTPHVKSIQRVMTTEMKDYEHWPESMEGYSHYFVEHWYIKNGMYGKFNQHLKKIVDTLKANDYPGYFAFYRVSSGGHGGEVGLVSPNKGWAGMSEQSPSFYEIMSKELGGEAEFEAFMGEFGSTYKTGQNMMLRYMPGASDYGD